MSLVLKRSVNGPRAHALVIGVGHYRYLSGGSDEKIQSVQQIGILKQLTSPPRSALAFSDWLIYRADNWRAPIATVELLISPAPEDADVGVAGASFEAATMANIRRAYGEWKTRCDSHEDNIAIFFYSGHGVEKSEHFLLAEDFGEQPNNPWLGAFAFDSTRRAFHSTRAKTQCFFVDACRKVTSRMLQQEIVVSPLDIVDITDSADCSFNLTMKASAKNEAAHGNPREVSFFTQALRAALDGGVAIRSAGKWQVQSGQVSARIHEVLGMIKEDQRFPQRCTSEVSDSTLLLETPPPKVRLTVNCIPGAANAAAELTCKMEPDGQAKSLPANGAPRQIDVEAGIYTVRADFAAPGFRPASDLISARPPVDAVELDCTP